MQNNFQKALSPFLIAISLLGVFWFDRPTSPQKLCYVIIYVSLTWSLNFGLVLYVFVNYEENFFNLLQILVLLFDLLTAVTTLCEGLYYRKKFQACLKRIAAVDNTLAALGTANEYPKLFRRGVKLVLTWFLFGAIVVVLSVNSRASTETVWKTLYTTYIDNYFHHLNTIVDIKFGVIMEYIGTRFDRVNEHIQTLLDDKMNSRRRARHRLFSIYRNSVNDEKSRRVIWTAIHLHLEISRISRELNAMVDLHTCCQMGSFFIVAVGFSFYLLHSFDLFQRYGFLFTLLVPCILILTYLLRLYAIIHLCETVTEKANNTGKVMEKLLHCWKDVEMEENVSQFVLHILQNPLRFSGLGLFYFDYNFLQSFYSYILTVFLIMLQTNTMKYISFQNFD